MSFYSFPNPGQSYNPNSNSCLQSKPADPKSLTGLVYSCSLCNVSCTNAGALREHVNGAAHKKKLAAAERNEESNVFANIDKFEKLEAPHRAAKKNEEGNAAKDYIEKCKSYIASMSPEEKKQYEKERRAKKQEREQESGLTEAKQPIKQTSIQKVNGVLVRLVPKSGKTFPLKDVTGVKAHLDRLAKDAVKKAEHAAKQNQAQQKKKTAGSVNPNQQMKGTTLNNVDGVMVRVVVKSGKSFPVNDVAGVQAHMAKLQNAGGNAQGAQPKKAAGTTGGKPVNPLSGVLAMKGTTIQTVNGAPVFVVVKSGKTFPIKDTTGVQAHLDKLKKAAQTAAAQPKAAAKGKPQPKKK